MNLTGHKIINFFLFLFLLLFISNIRINAKVSVHLLNQSNNPKDKSPESYLSNDIITEFEDFQELDYSYLSKSGRFLFNYTLTGVDAISSVDDNSNNIPDYIDSAEYYFEYVYDLYVNKLGMKSPLKSDNNAGVEPFEVSFYELGDYYYFDYDSVSYVSNGGVYGYTISKDRILPNKPFERYYSTIHIDNNFSDTDSVLVGTDLKYKAFYTYGMDALKVTIAHEFNHAIHMMYGLDYPYSVPFYEMHSVLMEDYVFPEVNDYVQYANSLFSNLSADNSQISELSANAGYRHSLFLMMLKQKYGIQIARRVMELTYEGNSNFKALDMTIKEFNPESSLSNEWSDYKDWIYLSSFGKIINPDKTFDDYKFFKQLGFLNSFIFESPAFLNTGNLDNFEIKNIRLIFKKEGTISDDTLNVMLTNINNSAVYDNIETTHNFSLNVSEDNLSSNYQYLDDLQMYFGLDKPDDIEYTIYTSTGEKTNSIEYSIPNPVNLNSDNIIYLPAPEKALLYNKLSYVVYDIEMNTIVSGNSEVIPFEGKRVIRIDDISRLSSGIYLFSVHYYDDILVGKIAVVRK
jgi:hypothetical protein